MESPTVVPAPVLLPTRRLDPRLVALSAVVLLTEALAPLHIGQSFHEAAIGLLGLPFGDFALLGALCIGLGRRPQRAQALGAGAGALLGAVTALAFGRGAFAVLGAAAVGGLI